ncbi:hypothetical protein EVAR_29545_1 [Eumeta japonica]|uniref:Uncharacterized protein n=1 Tax=Eumeta variegata TaxID=151549 RepID=A0A4C1WHC5_EUMVA|nr:hypothetical protein EVAR_29545_1 [Eumeta japonica]
MAPCACIPFTGAGAPTGATGRPLLTITTSIIQIEILKQCIRIRSCVKADTETPIILRMRSTCTPYACASHLTDHQLVGSGVPCVIASLATATVAAAGCLIASAACFTVP